MPGEGLPRQAFRRHEHQRQAQPAAQKHKHRYADLLSPEHPFRLRGVDVEPPLGCTGEYRQGVQTGDDDAGDERLAPDQHSLAQQPQRAEHATANAIEQPGTQARNAGDRVVGGAHCGEAALECFGHVHEVQQAGELVAGNPEAHAKPSVAERFGFALVDEDVIHPAVGTLLLRMLEQPERCEIDMPVFPGARLRDRACCIGSERRARLRLGDLAGEAVRRAVRAEAHARFRGLARLEQAHVPPVRRIQIAGQQRTEPGVAAGFELDKILRLAIASEHRRRARVGRREFEFVRECRALLKGRRARHLDVEVNQRQRVGEVAPRQCAAKRRQGGKRNPEYGLVGDFVHGHLNRCPGAGRGQILRVNAMGSRPKPALECLNRGRDDG